MADGHDCDVLIIGGGPVGIALALMLGRKGVRVIVTEKATEIYPLPRAAHVDHEIMRLFQSLGLADEIMATSRVSTRYDFLSASGEVLMRFEFGDGSSPSGWPASNMIHQPSLEASLRKALAGCDMAALKSGWTLEDFTEESDSVEGRFSTSDGEKICRAKYLIGCDGARSTVRTLAQIGVHDLEFDEPWLVVDTIVHDASRLPSVNLQICDPARPTTCVLMGNGRHRWEFMLKPGEQAETVATESFVAELLRPWNVVGAVSIERMAVYRFHALIARHWRKGRILLAGDAAHQMPPFAGQGLCSGLRDAANIARKLSAILHHQAMYALLDTYQPEREPNVRGIINLALMMGRTVCILDPVSAKQRDQMMLAARRSGSGPPPAPEYPPIDDGFILKGTAAAGTYFPQPSARDDGAVMRLDDVMGDGAWLIMRDDGVCSTDVGLRVISLNDENLRPYQRDLAHWLDRHNAASVLVRPDRYIFGTGAGADLANAWSGPDSAFR